MSDAEPSKIRLAGPEPKKGAEENQSVISVSFCTTCRNRLWQVQQTLRQNLDTLLEGQEICLIDYGSTDGLSHWVWSNFAIDIQAHRLRFFEVTNPVRWNVSRAKNLAHRIAQGKYLFSLDADNYITHDDIKKIQQAALANLIIHQFSGNWPDGSCGRIGIPKALFNELGGYDEGMLPMGGQDLDLLRRIAAMGVPISQIGPPIRMAIQNSIENKMEEIVTDHRDPTALWNQMNNFNLEIAKARLALEGPKRSGGFSSYIGRLNGHKVLIDGFDNMYDIQDE